MEDNVLDYKEIRLLSASLVVTFCFFLIEIFGGYLTNSLALQTDAWHMLNDVFALSFSLIAAWIAMRPETERKTYGYTRAKILAAFLQGIFLFVMIFLLIIEAFKRIRQPSEILSLNMLGIAFLGLFANGISAFILSRSEHRSLNVRGAFLHVISDILGSIGAISAGFIIIFTGWFQADSIISIILGLFLLYGSVKIVRESANILLEGVPSHINLDCLRKKIVETDGVKDIHDLHVWCITPEGMCVMSCHVVIKEAVYKKKLMEVLIKMLKKDFGIEHTTIQFEDEGYPKAENEH